MNRVIANRRDRRSRVDVMRPHAMEGNMNREWNNILPRQGVRAVPNGRRIATVYHKVLQNTETETVLQLLESMNIEIRVSRIC